MIFDDVLNCHDSNSEYFNKIVEECKKDKIIPFVGAGFSMPTYPSWYETLNTLASKGTDSVKTNVQNLLDENRYEDAADYIYANIGKGTFERTFKSIFSPEKIENIGLSNSVKLLTKVFNKTVITTNFDTCLEKAYSDAGKAFVTVITPRDKESLDNYLTQISRDNPHYLWKIHGNIYNFNQRVFTSKEYDTVYGNDSDCKQAFENFFSNNILLFLGCSLKGNDRYTHILKEKGQTAELTNYAILQRPEDEMEFANLSKLLSDHWICPIWYPYSDRNHESVSIILRELLRRLEGEKQTVDNIDPMFKKKNVRQLIEQKLSLKGINISIPTQDFVTLDDIVALCMGKTSKYSTSGLKSEIVSILGKVYDSKYLKFTYDKDVRKNSEWIKIFKEILIRNKIPDLSQKKTLVVGVGNGEEGLRFNYTAISENDNLILTDIAIKSLAEAEKKFPKALCINQSAQDLSRIATSSIDVYISTRVYQSSYFNIEKALYQATRVLKKNGLLIISISNGFLDKDDKSYIKGLIKSDGETIDKGLPQRYVDQIREKLKILNYKRICVDECKSEIYISAINNN